MDRGRLGVAARESPSRKKPARTTPVVGDEALWQALTRAGDGVFAIDPDGRISLWNRAAERILGWSSGDVLGRLCCEVLTGADGDGKRLCYQGCHVMSLVERGEPVRHFEMQTRTKTGQCIWLDTSILQAPPANGGGALTVHLFRDVTAVKELSDLARQRPKLVPPSPGNAATVLTRRELEILRLMATGANTRTLAERLHVSSATIRNHAQNILAKLEVHSRLEAVAWANQHRVV